MSKSYDSGLSKQTDWTKEAEALYNAYIEELWEEYEPSSGIDIFGVSDAFLSHFIRELNEKNVPGYKNLWDKIQNKNMNPYIDILSRTLGIDIPKSYRRALIEPLRQYLYEKENLQEVTPGTQNRLLRELNKISAKQSAIQGRKLWKEIYEEISSNTVEDITYKVYTKHQQRSTEYDYRNANKPITVRRRASMSSEEIKDVMKKAIRRSKSSKRKK